MQQKYEIYNLQKKVSRKTNQSEKLAKCLIFSSFFNIEIYIYFFSKETTLYGTYENQFYQDR